MLIDIIQSNKAQSFNFYLIFISCWLKSRYSKEKSSLRQEKRLLTLQNTRQVFILPHALAFKTLLLVDTAQDYKRAPVGISL